MTKETQMKAETKVCDLREISLWTREGEIQIAHSDEHTPQEMAAVKEWRAAGSRARLCMIEDAPEFVQVELLSRGYEVGETVAVWVDE
jgi:hypothetical protein